MSETTLPSSILSYVQFIMMGPLTMDGISFSHPRMHTSICTSLIHSTPNTVGRLLEGDPLYVEKLMHFSTHQFSRPLGRYLAEKGFDLHTQFGERFADNVLKFLRMEFHHMSPLSAAQISSTGYGERKIILLSDTIRLCKHKHNELHRYKQKKKDTSSTICTDSTEPLIASTSYVAPSHSLPFQWLFLSTTTGMNGVVFHLSGGKLQSNVLEEQSLHLERGCLWIYRKEPCRLRGKWTLRLSVCLPFEDRVR
jgi:hypothetical protein